jgi:IMP dehydrogenase
MGVKDTMTPFDVTGPQGQALPEGLTFDDVLLLPGYADFLPQDADLSTYVTRRVKLQIPLISAAMDTVTRAELAIALAQWGGLGIVHRNMSTEAQCEEVRQIKREAVTGANAALDVQRRLLAGAAVGAGDALERATALIEAGADVIAIDTAHGHSKNVVEALKAIKARYPDAQVMAGNIATAEAAKCLIEAGADALKVGIGPGSICTTRVVSGVGVPQVSAVRAVASVAQAAGVPVIADGGIRYSGDIPKAIAAGADVIMVGSLFAATKESPGQEILFSGRAYKVYRGMGSLGALQNETNDRYGKYAGGPVVPEGVEGMVPLSGSVADLVAQLMGGLRKGMGYVGLSTMAELKTQARFIRITAASVREGHAHDVTITNEAPNYSQAFH